MEFLALSGWPPVASLFAHAAAAGCALMEMHGCRLECACQYSIDREVPVCLRTDWILSGLVLTSVQVVLLGGGCVNPPVGCNG